MLTEDMFGALAEAIQRAKRIVFVGDPNQLSPIGAGKPFFELVQMLRNMSGQLHFAELKISNRQKKAKDNTRLDVELAKLFTDDQQKEVGDDIFSRISKDKTNIEFRQFIEPSEIKTLLLETIVDATKLSGETAGMENIDDIDGFDLSLGGIANGKWMNFNTSAHIEDWQIISPYRNDQIFGSSTLNRYIHEKYRNNSALNGSYNKRKTLHPLGNDGIIFGDKVINIRNQDRSFKMKGYPSEGCENYIANGETGIITRLWQKENGNKQNTHQIEFSSQKGFVYKYYSVISEGESDLELAYALTVHKVQGSGFKATIFILNEPENGPNIFLPRELIYTALTRQSDKVYILYNKNPYEIKKYASAIYSDLTRRLTNLFSPPVIREYDGGWYDNNLIHLTTNGEKVRSKSEVIIAEKLHDSGVNYIYEKELVLPDGSKWFPDFTIRTPSGEEVYWEHLGMLGNPAYKKRWEHKETVFAANSISVPNNTLFLTQDGLDGSIDVPSIQQIIEKIKSKYYL